MLPLLPLALSVVPELIKLIAGDKAGAVATTVANVVQEVTGTTDPAEAQGKLTADPALTAQLRIRLAEIALEAQKATDLAAEQKRQAELAALQKALENTQGARQTMVDLAKTGSAIAWGAPLVSAIVTAGFFIFLIVLIKTDLSTNTTVANVINITVGALAAAFATVVNFWLGSSQGSREKDTTNRTLQEAALSLTASTVDRTERAVQAVAAVASASTKNVTPQQATATPTADAKFDQCLAVVLENEGGFSDHPRDRGGATNLGITLRTLAEWQGLAYDDLDPGGKEKLLAELKTLTRREAAEIYRANYWLPMRCGDLPNGVDLMVFDFGVNAGPRRSVKLLQRVTGVIDDGSVGPKTLAAVCAANPLDLIGELADERLAYYRSLDNFDAFGNGWTNRTRHVSTVARAMAC